MFYNQEYVIPKTLYQNITTIAKENDIPIHKQIIICLDYAIKTHNKNKFNRSLYSKGLYEEDNIPYLDTIHFTSRYTNPELIKYIDQHNLTPIQFINLLNYGQLYQRLEERKELLKCHKYKLN